MARSINGNENKACPYCKSHNTIKYGFYTSDKHEYRRCQKYKCNHCKISFSRTLRSYYYRSSFNSEQIKKVFLFTLYNRKSIRETAKTLGIRKDTVSSLIRKGIQHQKEIVDLFDRNFEQPARSAVRYALKHPSTLPIKMK